LLPQVADPAMHPSSFENMQKCYDRYLAAQSVEPDRRWVVVEVGSADVNGSYRAIFPSQSFRYVGCDLMPGPGVDLVLDDPYRLPLRDAHADVVISGQMLEHCEFFWLAFGEMLRILKPEGYLFLIAPSSGPIHAYPVDCYRFHPDGFRALAKHSGCRLIELWSDDRGPWNDLVGVFRHAEAPLPSAAEIAHNLAAAQDSYRSRVVARQGINLKPSGGSPPEAEATKGAARYLEVLRHLHETLRPQLYLEIGVRRGRSLVLARGSAVGVDSAPEVTTPLPVSTAVYPETSDHFFEHSAESALGRGVDLAFIDGMHRAENVLRDIMGVERHARPSALLAIDDIFPNHPLQAERCRRTRVWCGDVWKIVGCLAQYRPDLLLLRLDVEPAGLLLVAGFEPAHRGLRDLYNRIARSLAKPASPVVPVEILAREGALPPDDVRVGSLLGLLKELAGNGADHATVRSRLRSWRGAYSM
jgi:SAM-dependent methyltransferase